MMQGAVGQTLRQHKLGTMTNCNTPGLLAVSGMATCQEWYASVQPYKAVPLYSAYPKSIQCFLWRL